MANLKWVKVYKMLLKANAQSGPSQGFFAQHHNHPTLELKLNQSLKAPSIGLEIIRPM